MRSLRQSKLVPLIALGAMWTLSACADDLREVVEPAAHAQAAKPEQLPRVMGPGMKATMSRHAEKASALTVSVALGDYEQTRAHVSDLLSEPRPAAPSPDEPGSLNQQLPPKLFALDDGFRVALGKLRDAAGARDDEATLVQLGAVVRACRACHRTLRPITKVRP